MVINTLFTITFAVELLAELRTWLTYSMSPIGTSRRTEGPEATSGFGVKQTLSIDGNDAIDPNRKSRLLMNSRFCRKRIRGLGK